MDDLVDGVGGGGARGGVGGVPGSVLPGDGVLVQGTGALSRLVRAVTRSPWSHAAMVGPYAGPCPLVWEVDWRGALGAISIYDGPPLGPLRPPPRHAPPGPPPRRPPGGPAAGPARGVQRLRGGAGAAGGGRRGGGAVGRDARPRAGDA